MLITLSASYGAGGSRLGPLLAERLGVPFHDRAIPLAVSERLDLPLEEVLAAEEPASGGLSRMVQGLAAVGALWGAPAPTDASGGLLRDEELCRAASEEIRRLAAGGDGVFLGRGAAFVLAGHPTALHVRLDGPAAARVRQAMALRGIDRAAAEAELARSDRAREAYVKLFYGANARDPAAYHLVCDCTAIDHDAVLDVVIAAARGRSLAAAEG